MTWQCRARSSTAAGAQVTLGSWTSIVLWVGWGAVIENALVKPNCPEGQLGAFSEQEV